MNITSTAYLIETKFFDEENRDFFIYLIGVSGLVRKSESRFRPERWFVEERHHLPFCTGLTRPVRLHCGAIAAPRKLYGVSNGNPECRAECGAEFYDILRLPLITHAQSIYEQHRTVQASLPSRTFQPSVLHCDKALPHASRSPWKHSCVLRHRATSILIQERYSSFVKWS